MRPMGRPRQRHKDLPRGLYKDAVGRFTLKAFTERDRARLGGKWTVSVGKDPERARQRWAEVYGFRDHDPPAAGTVAAHSSVAMDREGRYAIADFSYLPRETSITYAVIEAGGIPITDHNRVSRLVLKVRAKAPGPIDNIKDDIKTPEQVVEQKSPTELLVTVTARRPDKETALQLPIKNPELAEYLKPTCRNY